MPRLAIVNTGIVENVILGEPGFQGGIPCGPAVGPGWSYSDGAFTGPAAPQSAPPNYPAMDEAALNALLVQDGSILRAIVELVFQDRNAMAQAVAQATSLADLKTRFPATYTKDQFIAALKSKMRT